MGKKTLQTMLLSAAFLQAFPLLALPGTVVPDAAVRLSIPEPSGLSMTSCGDYIWCVSDRTGFLYKIGIDGKTVESHNCGLSDPEAVCDVKGTVYVAEERRNRIVRISDGKAGGRILLKKTGRRFNSGPEGLAFGPESEIFFVANEKKPVVISVYDSSFNHVRDHIMPFADISGLCFDSRNGKLWVLSHEDSGIYILDNGLNMVDNIWIDVDQAEGLALDYKRGFFYVCSDSDSLFYKFKIPERFFAANLPAPGVSQDRGVLSCKTD